MNENSMSNKETKILFLGLDNGGKSTILAKLREFKEEETVEVYPTPFFHAEKIQYESRIVTLVEVSGQPRFRKNWQMFYEDVDGIVFVIDGADQGRLHLVKELITNMCKDLQQVKPVVFLVNKQDMDGALSKNDVKKYLELDSLESDWIWTVRNCIGYTGTGTKEAVSFIIENL